MDADLGNQSKDETGNEGFALTKASADLLGIHVARCFSEQAYPSGEGGNERLEPLAVRSAMSRQHNCILDTK